MGRKVVELPAGFSPLDDEMVRAVLAVAEKDGTELYLVGGYLRDAIIREEEKRDHAGKSVEAVSVESVRGADLDFAVAGTEALSYARKVADELSGRYVLLDADNDTARVVLDDGTNLDFAGLIGESIEQDLRRRDFTINALAWSADSPHCLIDVVGGVHDIKDKIVRSISEQTLIDDPLRLLRAYRFCALLNAEMDDQTRKYVSGNRGKLASVAVERINYELFLALACDDAGELLRDMGELGLLEVIFPILRPTRKVTANQFHHLGLFDHSVEAVVELERCYKGMPDWVKRSSAQQLSFGVSRLAATKLATLLHDIGKPDTWNVNEHGRHTFYGHDGLGAEMASELAVSMKWSRSLGGFICKLIKWHLRPGQLFHYGEPTRKAVNRLFRTAGDFFPELMLLAFGDLGATRGDGLSEDVRTALEEKFSWLLDAYLMHIDDAGRVKQLLSGADVMRILSIEPGPAVGEVLGALQEAQDLKEVEDRRAAEGFVVSYYKKKYSR